MALHRHKKVQKVLGEFKRGKLKSSSGAQVTDRKQAIAIGLSEQRRARRTGARNTRRALNG